MREAIKNIHSDRDKGSRLYVTFLTPQERQHAQAKILAAKKVYPENEGKEKAHVWMGPQKFGDELIVSKILPQLKMAITDLESRVPPSADADSYKLVGGPLFAEWKLVKKEEETQKISMEHQRKHEHETKLDIE